MKSEAFPAALESAFDSADFGREVRVTDGRNGFKFIDRYRVKDGVVRLELDLSRFDAAPSARLSDLPLESDRAFPAQC